MNIILVRHGQTDWNKKDLLQGVTNIELNETGKEQAKETAKILEDVKIDLIYCSPLNRTLDTAKTINNKRNLEINVDNRLIERKFGDYEGTKGFLDLKKYWNLELNLSDNNVEPMKAYIERVETFLKDLYIRYGNTNKNILVVTHNGINLAISSLINGFIENIFEYNLKPCEYKIFENIKMIERGKDE